jgi:hypothetical protein
LQRCQHAEKEDKKTDTFEDRIQPHPIKLLEVFEELDNIGPATFLPLPAWISAIGIVVRKTFAPLFKQESCYVGCRHGTPA